MVIKEARLSHLDILMGWPMKLSTGVGSQSLLQGIFLTQGLNLCLLHVLCWQVDSLPPVHLLWKPKSPFGSCLPSDMEVPKPGSPEPQVAGFLNAS